MKSKTTEGKSQNKAIDDGSLLCFCFCIFNSKELNKPFSTWILLSHNLQQDKQLLHATTNEVFVQLIFSQSKQRIIIIEFIIVFTWFFPPFCFNCLFLFVLCVFEHQADISAGNFKYMICNTKNTCKEKRTLANIQIINRLMLLYTDLGMRKLFPNYSN